MPSAGLELTLQPLSAPLRPECISELSLAWQWMAHAPLLGEAEIPDILQCFNGIFGFKITYDNTTLAQMQSIGVFKVLTKTLNIE